MELEEGMAVFETMTTIELKINFLKPVWKTKLQAVAKIIKKKVPQSACSNVMSTMRKQPGCPFYKHKHDIKRRHGQRKIKE